MLTWFITSTIQSIVNTGIVHISNEVQYFVNFVSGMNLVSLTAIVFDFSHDLQT